MRKLASIVYLLQALLLSAQENFTLSHLSVDDGLAHNNIYSLYQDDYGYIWIGAGPNLHRYDGNQLITYKHRYNDPTSLPDGDIRCIFQDKSGGFWVGTDGGGLALFEDGIFTKIKIKDKQGKSISSTVEHMVEMPDGSLYLATWGEGIQIFKDGKFTQLRHDPENVNSLRSDNIVDLYYDDETEILWIGSWDGGLCYMEKGIVHRVPINKEGFNSKRARTITKANDGTLWVGSWGDGLFAQKGNKFVQYTSKDGYLGNDNVLTLKADGDDLWVGTWGGGITLLRNDEFNTFRQQWGNVNTFQSDFIECFLLDNSGSLWIGSFGSGLTRLEKKHFNQLRYRLNNEEQAESPTFIRSIIEDKEGRIWVAGYDGIKIYDGVHLKDIQSVYPFFPDLAQLSCLFKSANGDIWIGGITGVGLHVFDGQKVLDKSKWPGVNLKDHFVNNITERSDGSIMVSTDVDGGLHFIRNDSIESWYHDPENENSLSSSSIYLARETSDGTLWIGTSRKGLNAYRNGTFTRYLSDPNQPNSISNNYIYDLIETKDGSVWVGTESGLNKYDSGEDNFKHYFDYDGLINHSIMSLVEDVNENLWIGTHNGVSMFDPKKQTFQNFDRNSGLQTHPFQRTSRYFRPSTGELYMGGMHGMVIFNPDSVRKLYSLPSVRLTNLLINNVAVPSGENSWLPDPIEKVSEISLKRFDGNIAFEYSNLQFGAGPKYHYSYFLDGFEDDWNITQSTQKAIYSNLPVGNYTFMVRTSANGTDWGDSTRLLVRILPHWWETSFFIFGSIVLLSCLVFGTIMLRFRLLRKREIKLQRLINEKTEELNHANQKLKSLQEKRVVAQENERMAVSREVHDGISQTLFGIRLMINRHLNNGGKKTIEVPREVDSLLNEVIQDTRLILNNLGTSYLSYKTFKESLENLLGKAERLTGSTIQLSWEGDDHIKDVLVGTNIFRIIQESLTNAMKHAQADEIAIKIRNTDQINCIIIDDGVGFKYEESKGKGHGLQNMHVRANEINAILNITSSDGKGTKVSIKL